MNSNKKDVKLRILVTNNREIRRIGNLIISRLRGDIYYVPSSKEYLDTSEEKKNEIIHFTWHESGNVHLKLKINIDGYKKIHKGLKIKEMGFQDLFRDLIVDPIKLSLFEKTRDEKDIIFNIKNYTNSILLSVSIISGKLIVKRYRGEETPLNFVNVAGFSSVVGLEKRALGFESGNSDKLVQIILLKTSDDASKLRTKRRILILPDQNISNT